MREFPEIKGSVPEGRAEITIGERAPEARRFPENGGFTEDSTILSFSSIFKVISK